MKYRLGLHIIFWLAYLLFESYIEFAWISASFKDIPPLKRWGMALLVEFLQLPIKLLLSYFIVYLVNNGLSKFRKPVFVLLAGLFTVAVAVVLQRFLIGRLILPYVYDERLSLAVLFKLPRVITTFLDLLFIAGFVVAIKQFRLSQRVKENQKVLVKEKLEAELKFLRTQTNPHFLFNTLNNIYALARKKSDDTADVVMKLSKLLRFMLYESRKSNITLAEELRVLSDYIELERIRYNERLSINFTKNIDNEAQLIAPLILLPFVENAFKHGASETRFDSFIHIDAQLKQGKLKFTIENSKDEEKEETISENIGLSNVRRQLELIYPEHRLEMNSGKQVFKVQLTINLNHREAV